MFLLNQLGHYIDFQKEFTKQVKSKESFHSANTNNPRGSDAVPKPKRLPFGDE